MMYSIADTRLSGLTSETFIQWFTKLGINVEASQISDVGVLKVLHLTLSGVAPSHCQTSILPKLRAENMHLHSVLDLMSAYYLNKAMQPQHAKNSTLLRGSLTVFNGETTIKTTVKSRYFKNNM
jgi:hypothetical protein